MTVQRQTPVIRDLLDEPHRILAALEAALAGSLTGPAASPGASSAA